jgi:hypothetical protein
LGISKLGKSNWGKRKIDWSLKEQVKMWKKIMCWGGMERLYVCTF